MVGRQKHVLLAHGTRVCCQQQPMRNLGAAQTADRVATLAQKARPGFCGERIDARDVIAVREAANEAIGRDR